MKKIFRKIFTPENIIDDLNDYIASVDPATGISPHEPTSVHRALDDLYFNWGTHMPEGPYSGLSALCAILYLVTLNNEAGMTALWRLASRPETDWQQPQGKLQVTPLQCLAIAAVDQQDALDLLMSQMKHFRFNLNTHIGFGKMANNSYLFAIMQSVRRGNIVSPDFYQYIAQQVDLNWDESLISTVTKDKEMYPATSLAYLKFAAKNGHMGAQDVLDLIPPPNPMNQCSYNPAAKVPNTTAHSAHPGDNSIFYPPPVAPALANEQQRERDAAAVPRSPTTSSKYNPFTPPASCL